MMIQVNKQYTFVTKKEFEIIEAIKRDKTRHQICELFGFKPTSFRCRLVMLYNKFGLSGQYYRGDHTQLFDLLKWVLKDSLVVAHDSYKRTEISFKPVKACEHCHIYIHPLCNHTGHSRWCEDCFEKGLQRDMDDHFCKFIKAEAGELPAGSVRLL